MRFWKPRLRLDPVIIILCYLQILMYKNRRYGVPNLIFFNHIMTCRVRGQRSRFVLVNVKTVVKEGVRRLESDRLLHGPFLRSSPIKRGGRVQNIRQIDIYSKRVNNWVETSFKFIKCSNIGYNMKHNTINLSEKPTILLPTTTALN